MGSIAYVEGGDDSGRFSPAAYLTTRTRSTVTRAPPVTISSRIGSNFSTWASSSITSIKTGRSVESSTGAGGVNHTACAESCNPVDDRRAGKAVAAQPL